MKLTSLVFLPALLPASVLAGTAIFTDSHHLPANLPPDVPVVLLDGPDRLQADIFGELPADPAAGRGHTSGRLWRLLPGNKNSCS
jgi:hypothetical protein